MTTAALTLSIQGAPEQDIHDVLSDEVMLSQACVNDAADLADISRMMTAAASGMSASALLANNCGVRYPDEDSAEFALEFYAWPSRIDMTYNLSASIGVIGPREIVEDPADIEIVSEMSKITLLDAVYTGELSPTSPAFDSDGASIQVSATLHGSRLILSREAFACYRLVGLRHGHKYKLTLTFTGLTEAHPTKIEPIIVATWQDADGKTKRADLTLIVPDCIIKALDRCPADSGGGSGHINKRHTKIWYSTCHGRILEIRHEYS